MNRIPWGHILYRASRLDQGIISFEVSEMNRWIIDKASANSIFISFSSLLFQLLLGFCSGCSALPPLKNRPSSTALLDTHSTRLDQVITPLANRHPGKTGIYPLAHAREAFAARILLARAAERSLDVQYYIWRKDKTGTLLFAALHDAANRGVRVRLLLDDNNTSGLDETLAALDVHPNIEIRLFNPFVHRKHRILSYLTDFQRVNRRMHNKSFTADNQATIVGGRNIGDEYFGATDEVLFADLDVMAVGPVVTEVSNDFDRYWSSGSSYPADLLLPEGDHHQLAELAAAAQQVTQSAGAAAYIEAIRNSSLGLELNQGRLTLEWAEARMISDDPAKGLGLAVDNELLSQKLRKAIGEPRVDVELISPYFVPTMTGVEAFAAMAARGVTIRILTNSYKATDVSVVHAGYAKYRRPLLKAGITLYELKNFSSQEASGEFSGFTGSSGTSLHAKTFSVDSSRIFVGSFNFDPRSAKLNTEMGFVIESAALATQIKTEFKRRIPTRAYEVQLSDYDKLCWLEQQDQKTVCHTTEPDTNVGNRVALRLMSVMPIEWLL
jgi:putative cardiolipin synthase